MLNRAEDEQFMRLQRCMLWQVAETPEEAMRMIDPWEGRRERGGSVFQPVWSASTAVAVFVKNFFINQVLNISERGIGGTEIDVRPNGRGKFVVHPFPQQVDHFYLTIIQTY